MRRGDLKNFLMTHQHTETRNHFPWTKRGTLTEPHYVLRNPCWRAL